MSQIFTDALQNLIDALGKMPGVGPKSAQRIAFWVLQTDPENIKNLAATLQTAKDTIRFCETCGNITENPVCQICVDPRRDRSLICVVEEAKDIASLEKTRSYRGLYHVLGGAIDPINGIGPDQLRIKSLMERLQDAKVKEVIIATNPNVEGEATATYLSRLLATLQIPASRLASGLPVGSDLEYADEVTLSRALEGRHSLE
ncbi:recombination mediator RecR [Mobiluncus mulieris]|uniref:Recombination protein RecR n=2 Tax=Mobiluncus mulieris TaxID=2052 RepID=E0QMZ4_9ACTO|nr:recombination mediator RecR [Mobiluncus mulieris]EEJ53219.1 recombination protein RecR [Mobiluncus mulieris ATCC 35243]EFM47161.1 recombination protein RecR [Mobiluncus mulieris ATCC 35239]EFN93558.1 recombination protein RecR [Mobiluncus mulieris FB024-16]MCU9968880.1 recombination protein RecR [Mobiluncus mulieris]MCU9971223.1 recombination protein RecR [Mobiluncus mulieris]